ncbi:MAG: glycoside hydrolase [Candidatus Manganitrophaceae bacterium]
MRRWKGLLFVLFGFWLGAVSPSAAEPVHLESEELVLEVNGETGGFTMTDKQSKEVWRSVAGFKVENLKTDAGVVRGEVKAKERDFKVSFTLRNRELDLQIEGSDSPGKGGGGQELDYPPPLVGKQESAQLVIPYAEGILLPAKEVELAGEFSLTKREYAVYAMSGLSMPWFGEIGPKAGYMAIFETPYDAALKLDIGSGRFLTQVRWKKTLGKWGDARRMRFVFFDLRGMVGGRNGNHPEGGYVAMAKYYRKYAFSEGVHKGRAVPTLEQEAKRNPEVLKLIGALDWWEVGKPDLAFLAKLKGKGVRKILYQNIHGHPDHLLKAEEIERIKKLGFLASRYDVYGDILTSKELGESKAVPPWVAARGRAYSDDASEAPIIGADGRPVSGFKFGNKGTGKRRSGVYRVRLAKELIAKELREAPYNARFIDVEGAVGLFEDYSPKHPMTREQDAGFRRELLENTKREGLVVGTEHGHDYLIGSFHYGEGMEMLIRLMEGVKKSDLSGREVKTPEGFLKFNLGEKYRVPLYQLVYHDYVVSTWRWNNTPNRFAEDRYWKKWNLFQMLYGTMPILLGTAKQLEAKMEGVLRTYKDVSEWHEKIGYDELVDHRILKEDKTVQESRFGSGWAVVVNFGDQTFKVSDKKEVSAMSYLTYRWVE